MVRQKNCVVLKTGTDDEFEVGKILVPILVPLSLADTISIPRTPMVVSAIAMATSRMDTKFSPPRGSKEDFLKVIRASYSVQHAFTIKSII